MESLPGISCAGILPHSVLVRRCVDVFIVEDFPAIRQRLHSALEAVPGVRVVGRADGADEATAAVARLEPQFVVLDLRLGQGSGLGVLEAVERLAGAPVVAMVTSDPNDQYRARCAALGAEHFFDKARDLDSLLGVVPAPGRRRHGPQRPLVRAWIVSRSPVSRAELRQVLQNQMDAGEPAETKQTFDRLLAAGIPEDEVWRLMSAVLAGGNGNNDARGAAVR